MTGLRVEKDMTDTDNTQILYEAICAIAESYTSIVYVDVTDRRVYPIRLDDYASRYREAIDAGHDMETITSMYVRETVFPDDAEAMMSLADIGHVRKKLESENQLFYVYRCMHDGKPVYYRLKIVPIEGGTKLIYGFENFDKQFRTQLQIKAEREMQMMLVDGLSREYLSVWHLDGKSRKVALIRNNGAPEENAEPVRIGETMIDYHFSMQKYFGDFVSGDDFDRLMRETSYEALVKNASEGDLYRINYTRINTDKTTSHFQVCYAKIVDAAGIADFVFGFRIIDN